MGMRYAWLLSLAALMLVAPGCSHPERQVAVPEDLTTKAVIPGIPGARYWTHFDNEAMLRDGLAGLEQERAFLARSGHKGRLPPAIFLAVSGGGDNGAFGAGLLIGWTEAGDRPEFKIVTGISTGALIAPFAYLGPDYDDELRTVFTTISPDDVLEKRNLLAALFDDAMADNAPLWKLVGRFVNDDMLRAIAREHEKGRFLLIGTTNLDARRAVVWNMGAIAASGDPKALGLFRSILVASAAIPGAFPPVMINVEAQGTRYQEMHVDGGAMAQVILYPASINLRNESERRGITRERRLYIIRNARLDPEWASVERQTLSIVGRAIQSLIHTQGIGDLYRIYLIAQRDGVDYHLAYIPQTFDAVHEEEFDTIYMRALFDTAFKMARTGYPWHETPPGYQRSE